nr:unnamed protein product [Leishmania braziliensis]
MNIPGKHERTVAEVARRECALLTKLATANRRSSVYRHHLFFRRSRHAVQLARKCYNAANPKLQRCDERRQSAALLSAHRALIKAVEHCTAELAANRIDTIALCVAFIAILSRLGCCVGKTILLEGGAARLPGLRPGAHARDPEAARGPRPPPGPPPATQQGSLGGVLRALRRRRPGGDPAGRGAAL